MTVSRMVGTHHVVFSFGFTARSRNSFEPLLGHVRLGTFHIFYVRRLVTLGVS